MIFMVYEDFNDIPGPLAASAPIFAKLEILKLKDIFIFQISRFIHNCLRSEINNNFIIGSYLMRFIITIQYLIIKLHSI